LALFPIARRDEQQVSTAPQVSLMLLQPTAVEGDILYGPQHASPDSSGSARDVESANSPLTVEQCDSRWIDVWGQHQQSSLNISTCVK
jgi:hypothetical protein